MTSTNETTPAADDLVQGNEFDLEDFSKDFFSDNSNSGEDDQNTDDATPSDDDNDNDEEAEIEQDENDEEETESDTDSADESEEEEDSEESPEPEDKPKQNRAQKRINELVKERETAKRELEAERSGREQLEKRLAELEAKLNPSNKPIDTTPAPENSDGPSPTDTNEDGTDKYPLGEYDPQYIRDLTRHTLAKEQEQFKKANEEAEAKRQAEQKRQELTDNWNTKLTPAKERYPDFDEKGQELFGTFSNIDQQYGEYLSSVIMDLDHGPDVLYYLANNLDEANEIISKGPTGATIALGRIEGKFADADLAKKQARPKTSKAPAPPKHTNRGSAQTMPRVKGDTDDLDAFSRELFKG